MNKETFDQATRINHSIEHFEEMKADLKMAFDNLCRNKTSTDDAKALGQLIEYLIQEPKGEYVVNMFVNHFTLEIDDMIKKLRKEFEEL